VDDEPAGTGAALPGRTYRAEYRTDERHIQIGIFGNNNSVVAAQFQQAFAQAGPNGRATALPMRVDPVADTSGTRVSLLISSPMFAVANNQAAYTFFNIIFKNLLRYVLAGNGRQRCFFGWFPDAYIAANPGQHGVPAPNRHREVKGRYNAYYTQRVILLVHAVLGPFAVHGKAVKLAAKPNGKIADVYHFLYLAVGLPAGFCPSRRIPACPVVFCSRAGHSPICRTISPRFGAGMVRQVLKGLAAHSTTVL
jgi:hypothetical protein